MQITIHKIIQSFCIIYLPHVVNFEITDYYKRFLSISNLISYSMHLRQISDAICSSQDRSPALFEETTNVKFISVEK